MKQEQHDAKACKCHFKAVECVPEPHFTKTDAVTEDIPGNDMLPSTGDVPVQTEKHHCKE